MATRNLHEEISVPRYLLAPLKKCRSDTFYMPWKCEVPMYLHLPNHPPPPTSPPPLVGEGMLMPGHHSYEKCQYVEFKKRVAKMGSCALGREDGVGALAIAWECVYYHS